MLIEKIIIFVVFMSMLVVVLEEIESKISDENLLDIFMF